MYFSEKRKQGLGSLRPGYFLGGTIGKFLLGNALNWGINKGIDYATKTPQQREDEKLAETFRRLGIQPYISEDTSGDQKKDDKKSSTFKGRIGSGILSLLATALLGPLAGPLVLRAGKGLMNRRNQMSLMPSGDPSNIGPQSGKVTTLDGKTVDFGSDDYVADMKARDKAFQETGDYDVYADTPTSSPTYSPPDPSTYTYEGSDEQDRDNEDTASTAGDAPGYSGPSPFEYGGRVSYSKGGIASLWQR